VDWLGREDDNFFFLTGHEELLEVPVIGGNGGRRWLAGTSLEAAKKDGDDIKRDTGKKKPE